MYINVYHLHGRTYSNKLFLCNGTLKKNIVNFNKYLVEQLNIY